jgi:hypothetical protein
LKLSSFRQTYEFVSANDLVGHVPSQPVEYARQLRDAYIAVDRPIMQVVRGSDDDDAPDAWHEDVTGPQPDTITRAVNATADAMKQLYDTYPAELGTRPESPQLPPAGQNRIITG